MARVRVKCSNGASPPLRQIARVSFERASCGALSLGLFCLVTACLFHTNFSIRNELLHFEKDIAIAGGMFVLVVCGAGRWSMDGRLRATPDA